MKINKKVIIKNRKASFNYKLLDSYEAGMELLGTEIKSIRMNQVSITESFCQFKENELYVINMMIHQYKFGIHCNHNPRRERKLLLKKLEINKLLRKTKVIGLTIIPLRLYINDKGLAKLTISLAKGKKLYDKREAIKQQDLRRTMQSRNRNI